MPYVYFATDGLGSCLIAGSISVRSASTCWTNPGLGFFVIILFPISRLTSYAAILMIVWDGRRRIYML